MIENSHPFEVAFQKYTADPFVRLTVRSKT